MSSIRVTFQLRENVILQSEVYVTWIKHATLCSSDSLAGFLPFSQIVSFVVLFILTITEENWKARQKLTTIKCVLGVYLVCRTGRTWSQRSDGFPHNGGGSRLIESTISYLDIEATHVYKFLLLDKLFNLPFAEGTNYSKIKEFLSR